jgi:predicted nucleic acid-binding protein
MQGAVAYDGRVFIADTSAWSHGANPAVKDEWVAALRNRQVATCPIVRLELLYSARDGTDLDRLDPMLAGLRDLPITRSVTDSAFAAFRQLAHVQPLYHRGVRLPDLLIAATAQDAALGVLHYDAHFDRLAEVLEFESRWISPPGSL